MRLYIQNPSPNHYRVGEFVPVPPGKAVIWGGDDYATVPYVWNADLAGWDPRYYVRTPRLTPLAILSGVLAFDDSEPQQIGALQHRVELVLDGDIVPLRQRAITGVRELLLARLIAAPFGRFWLSLEFSAPTLPQRKQHVEECRLVVHGAYPRIWEGARHGFSDPVYSPDDDSWSVTLLGNVDMADGMAVAVSGAFIDLHPQNGSTVPPLPIDPETGSLARLAVPPDEAGRAIDELSTAAALYDAPLCSMILGDDESVLPHTKRPTVTWPERNAEIIAEYTGWVAQRDTGGDLFDAQPLVQRKYAGGAGEQPGFGRAKLAKAYSGSGDVPLVVPAYLHMVEDAVLTSLALRPIHHREADESRVLAADHVDPLWRCESQYTDYRDSMSPDRLGKDRSPADWHGWFGFKRSHIQPMVELTYYAMTHHPLVRVYLDDLAEGLLSEHILPSAHPEAFVDLPSARGIGRLLQTLVVMASVLDRSDLLERAEGLFDEIIEPRWVGRDPSHAVRPIAVHGPDPRGIGDLPFYRPPFQWIAVMGLCYLARATGAERWKRIRDVVDPIARTMLGDGFRYEGGRPRVAWGVPYQGGRALTEHERSLISWGGGDWELWSHKGIQLAAELMPDANLGTELFDLAAAIRRHYRHEEDARKRWKAAEWLA